MKNLILKIFFVGLLLALFVNNADAQKRFKGFKKSNGAIVGTFTIVENIGMFNRYSLKYKPIEKKNGFFSGAALASAACKAAGFKKKFKSDYSIGKKHVFLFYINVDEGIYDIYDYELFTNLGMSQGTLSAKEKFSIPFEVEKGEFKYIGNITLNFGGTKMFEWNDEYERDIAKLKSKFGFYKYEVTNAVPNKKQVVNYLFDFKE